MTTIFLTSEDIYVRQNSGQFQYSSSSSFNSPTVITAWPIRLNNISVSNKNVFIVGNLDLTSANIFFVMDGPNITLDGQNNIVNVNNVSNYPGLVQNGTSGGFGQNNIIIQNLGITSSGSTSLANGAGWVGQEYINNNVGTSCQVNNCYSSGAFSGIGAGGIFGRDSRGTANNCYSSGVISGFSAGGIFGRDSRGTANNCYSSGAISGHSSGGIFGAGSRGTATNCYSSGAISGMGAGGIFGQQSSGTATATNCYSSGAISGSETGGIFGAFSNGTATNCYSSGAISGSETGGIFGAFSNGTATNCYSSGVINGFGAGGIFSNFSGVTATNCYIANGSWSDSAAASNLTGAPTYSSGTLTAQGNVWIDINLSKTNTPWLLKSFIPLNMGPVQFSTIAVVGTNWLFGGIVSTNSFIQESPSTFRIGTMTFGIGS